jgi:HlyD family secretion protein
LRARWTIGVVVLVGAAAAIYWGPLRPKAAPIRYREAEVTRGEILSRVSATGTLSPVDQVEIGSQVSGTIQRISVDYNSRVRAGQVLAQLDPALFRANRSQAEANVEKARVAVQDAERTLARARDLKSQGLVSQADLDAAETAFGSRRAELRQAEAALELAEVNLANTTITSPIAGIVISRNIDVGQTVAASLQAPKLFLIARDLSEMELEARVDEADIGQVRQGQPVTFTVDSYPDRAFGGRILQVRAEPIEESGVVSYVTVARVPNPDGRLLPGMTANVTIITATRDDALRVPNAALRYRPKPEEKAAPQDAAATPSGTARAQAEGRETARPGSAGAARRETARAGSARSDSVRPEDASGKSSTVYVLRRGAKAPEAVRIRTGITDGTVTEVLEGPLEAGTVVVIGEIESGSKRVSAPNPLGGQPAGPPSRGGPRRGGI